jgi:ABC-type branched-subunit amino acid transport system ATPase component
VVRRRTVLITGGLCAAVLLQDTVDGVSLRTEELTSGYQGSPVIHDVSISVEPGKVVSIVGPNGSGKGTLLKSLVGLVGIMSGKVFVGDRDVTAWPTENVARIGVGYVPQVDDVFPPLSVRENLEMGAICSNPVWCPLASSTCSTCFPNSAAWSAAGQASSAVASARCSPWAGR